MIFEIFCLALRDHFKYYFEKEKKTKSDWSILKLSESDNQSDLLRRFRTVRGSHENQNSHYQKQKKFKSEVHGNAIDFREKRFFAGSGIIRFFF